MPRKKYEVDYKTLKELCAIHCTGEECAAILGVDYDTLNRALKRDKHGGFTDYFKKYSADGKKSLRRRQVEVALDGSVPMLIWLGKQHLGQADKQEQTVDLKADVKQKSISVEMTPEQATEIYQDMIGGGDG